ncbi:DUF554 domain-containing protein [Lacticaseibacillus yichunensis]|uniref:DUF554 domain-containing protein n=1 Tax=Lacticaseibacillus yichunensis TaxID=2486015 RepID=A0ABW4CTF1_9LACO|nr:DUF554 domain-containing protein [Lacticaseibacillus yichunensis]
MTGTLFNTVMIIVGSAVGALFKRGMNETITRDLMTGLGLAVVCLGLNTTISHMGASHYPVLFIASLAIGAVIGSALRLEDRFDHLLARFDHEDGGPSLAQGLATGILLYCIGTLSIVGPMQAALKGDQTFLFTNGMLDGITAMVLASTFGIGMIAAAPVLFCWQGAIFGVTLLASDAISSAMITELTITGGALILASGLGLLKIKDCHPMNLLPALAVPLVVVPILQAMGL